MKNYLTLSAAAVAGLTSFAATAHADPFEGPYVGVSVGFDRDVTGPKLFDGSRLDTLALKSSADFGAFAGQNYRIGNRFVFSPEVGINFSTNDIANGIAGADRIRIDPKRQFELSARAGYLVTDKLLAYARGGYSNLRARTELTSAGQTTSTSRSLDGYVVGAGLEYAVLPSVTARLEYRYNDYKQESSQFRRHQALAGVAYHF